MSIARPATDEVVHFEPERARVTINGQRAVLLGADAMGQLRSDLIANLGPDRARGFLTRYGWNCGHNDALAMAPQFADRDPDSLDWLQEGMRLHAIEGITRVEMTVSEIDREAGTWYKEAACYDSYEAEQHLRHCGVQSAPACWIMVGYASGYTSAYFGRTVYYRETECLARGDERCYLVGMTPEQWGADAADDIAYYSERFVGEELAEAYERIQEQRDELEQIVALQDRLAGMVLRGEDLSTMVRTLAEQLELEIVVEDRLGQAIAAWPVAGGVRRAAGRGLSLLAAGETVGRVLVTPKRRHSHRAGRIATEQVATVCGLALMRDRVAANAEHRLHGELLERLLAGDAGGVDEIARLTGPLPAAGLRDARVVVIEPGGAGGAGGAGSAGGAGGDVRGVLEELGHDATRRFAACRLASSRGGRLVALVVPDADDSLDAVCDGLEDRIGRALPGPAGSLIGIGGAGDVARSHGQAVRALAAAGDHADRPRRLRYDDLPVHALLAGATSGDDLDQFAATVLDPLAQHDGDQRSGLMATLRAYLDERGRIKDTAARLNVHVSTLKYRLAQIEELTGVNLHDGEDFFRVGLALRIRDGAAADGAASSSPNG